MQFSKYKPPGAYIWRGDLTESFLRYRFGGLYMEGLIFGILRYTLKIFCWNECFDQSLLSNVLKWLDYTYYFLKFLEKLNIRYSDPS